MFSLRSILLEVHPEEDEGVLGDHEQPEGEGGCVEERHS